MRKSPLIPLVFAVLAIAAPAAAAQDGAGAADPNAYRIGIEDVLGIVVWKEPELTLDAQVRPDGKITVPLLNDVHVAGSTPEALAARLTEALGRYITAPNVTVMVRQINSYKVYFLGEVTTQGEINFQRPTRLLQGIAAAGGVSQFSKKEITLVREIGGIEKRFAIDYKKLLSGDPAQENLLLRPNDMLVFH